MSKKTKAIAICGVMTAVAMIFSYIESLFPIPIPVYGVKLGIANIAIITVLFVVGKKEAFIVNIIRIALTAMLFGNLNSFLFSIAGGFLSLVVMIGLQYTKRFSTVGISVAGGVFHNIGQTIAAVFIMETGAIIYYLPVLLISGIVTGIVIGIVSGLVVKRVKSSFFNMEN
ncbi:MAG: Gx transporter family protein [Lachnospira sp.]|nr:Gx transporter family protein [Lachnospira sp.]